MEDGPSVPVNIGKPLGPGHYRITGRIRDEGNLPVGGYIVQAFDRDRGIYPHSDDRLGKAKTNEDGAFEIIFNRDAFEDWFEANPEVYLVVRGRDGRVLINTQELENATGIMDFQIKMGRSEINPLEPDLYAGNFTRMASALKEVFDLESLSGSDVRTVVEVLSRAIGSWLLYRDELARYAGYDGIQVPEHPRRADHNHVTRWDKAVLPF
ncbi:MAG TPA: hypothetical protein VLB04_02145 [Methanotrichaceae archaeon]|nr:hypothetical protein [Methanotrichaceae archaeon]